MSERSSRTRKAIATSAAAAALVIGASAELRETPKSADPNAIAATILANRFDSCDLKLHSSSKEVYSKNAGPDAKRYDVDVQLDLKMNDASKELFEEYREDSGVQWKNSEIVTRALLKGFPKYLESPGMPNTVESSEDGQTLKGTLNPSTFYTPGSTIDVWKDQSTNADGAFHLSSIYCGRLLLKDNAWTLDTEATEPFAELHEATMPFGKHAQYSQDMLVDYRPIANIG